MKKIWKNEKKKNHQPKICQRQKNDIIWKRLKQKFNNKQTLNEFIIWTRHDANSIWYELRVQRHNLHCWD